MVDTLLLSDSLPRILWIFIEQLLQRTPLVEFFWLLRSYYSLKILLFSFHCLSIGFIASAVYCPSAHRLRGWQSLGKDGEGAEVAKKIIDWGRRNKLKLLRFFSKNGVWLRKKLRRGVYKTKKKKFHTSKTEESILSLFGSEIHVLLKESLRIRVLSQK